MIFPKDSLIKMIRLITDLALHGISCLWQIPVSTSSNIPSVTPSLTPSFTTSFTTSFDDKINTSTSTSTTVQQKELEVIDINMKRKCLIRMSAISLLSSLANTNNYKDIIISDCVCVLITSAENCQSNR